MGLYVGADNFPASIYQFEETDLVQAATDNVPLQHLADRTVYLKERIGLIDRLQDEVIITGTTSLPASLSGNLITAYASGALNMNLEDAATFKHGALIFISSFCDLLSVVNVKPLAGQPIYDTDGSVTEMNMHHKEQLILCALTGHWKVVSARGNFYCAGEEIKARKELINTIALKGQLLNRSLYPRLWKFAQSLTNFQEIVTEALWFSDATTYRGCFTTGDGATTFRLPDERGMFDRMMDAGRGIDFNRIHNYPGGYEKDAIIDHYHNVNPNPNANSQAGWGKMTTGGDAAEGTLPIIKSSGPYNNSNTFIGSNETIVKNIGKLNCIKF